MKPRIKSLLAIAMALGIGASLNAKTFCPGLMYAPFRGEEIMLIPPTDPGWSSFSTKWVLDFPLLHVEDFEVYKDLVTLGFEYLPDGSFHYWGTGKVVEEVGVGAVPIGLLIWDLWGFGEDDGTWAGNLSETGLFVHGPLAGLSIHARSYIDVLPSHAIVTTVKSGYLSAPVKLKRAEWIDLLED